MNRRDYLRWAGVAGAGVLAGCSAQQSETDGEFTPQSADHLAVAVGNLNTVSLAVDEFQTGDDPREETFEETRPRERLETAREALEEAEKVADGSTEAEVEAVREYATVVAGTVDAVVDLLAASESLEETESELEGAEGELGIVEDLLTQARNASDGAVKSRDRALEASDAADSDRLSSLDAEFEAVRDGLEMLSGYVTGVDGLCGGYLEYLAGVEQLHHADDGITDDSVTEAREAFERSIDDFESAESRFAEVLSVAPDAVAAELETGQKRSIALTHFSTGHVLLLDGHAVLDGATSAFEDEDDDSARESLRDGNEAALTASEEFDAGVEVASDEFDDQFETADGRAAALEALTAGYLTLLDARESVMEGEDAVFDDEYDEAIEAFQSASEQSSAAADTFTTDGDAEELFAEEFEQASRRAAALTALADGYTALTGGVEAIENGREQLDARAFDAAAETFGAAGAVFETATQEFETGQNEAGDEFAEEFTRALCRVGHLTAASDHFETAAEAASDGDDRRFETERENGEEQLGQADDC